MFAEPEGEDWLRLMGVVEVSKLRLRLGLLGELGVIGMLLATMGDIPRLALDEICGTATLSGVGEITGAGGRETLALLARKDTGAKVFWATWGSGLSEAEETGAATLALVLMGAALNAGLPSPAEMEAPL